MSMEILLIAVKVSVWLGDTEQAILNHIMGILLAAVEIIVAGLRALFPQFNLEGSPCLESTT